MFPGDDGRRMSLAAETRAAVRARPWLLRALRAGVVNYTAAAESLDIEGDRDAVATALRRFEDDLSPVDDEDPEVTVRMRSGVGLAGADAEAGSDAAGTEQLVSVGGEWMVQGGGRLTAILVDGDVDAGALSTVVDRLDAENVVVDAAGVVGDCLVVVVPRSDGANALRLVEDALADA